MWKEIADKENQQALYECFQEADRQNSRIEKAKVNGKLSLSQKSGLSAIEERRMLDDEIQAQKKSNVGGKLKMAGKKLRKQPRKKREAEPIEEKTGQQERKLANYKNQFSSK